MRNLEDILGVILIEERQVNLRPVLTLKDKLVSQNFCTLEHGLSKHEVKDTLPLFIGDRRIKFGRIEGFKLNFEVLHQCVIIRNIDCAVFLLV